MHKPESIQELCATMQSLEGSDLFNDGGKRAGIDICDLPTFGGDEPNDTIGIFSWDPTHYLTCGDYGGRSDGGWCLVPRDEWSD